MDGGKHWKVLAEAISGGILHSLYFGTPCGSHTWARAQQVRDFEHPRGLRGLSANSQRLVDDGNFITDVTLCLAVLCWEFKGYFVLENPWPSWVWIRKILKFLHSLLGVIITVFAQQPFGVLFEMLTGILPNIPDIQLLGEPRDMMVETIPLRGRCMYAGEAYWKTRLSETYPVDMSYRFAWLLDKALKCTQQALQLGRQFPMADKSCDALPVVRPVVSQRLREQAELAWFPTWRDCPDIERPFVQYCNGCPVGLSPMKRLSWGIQQRHPADGNIEE